VACKQGETYLIVRNARKVILLLKIYCKDCSRTNKKIDPLTNLNKYLYNGKTEMKVAINKQQSRKTL
jgi:hypothetical protein